MPPLQILTDHPYVWVHNYWAEPDQNPSLPPSLPPSTALYCATKQCLPGLGELAIIQLSEVVLAWNVNITHNIQYFKESSPRLTKKKVSLWKVKIGNWLASQGNLKEATIQVEKWKYLPLAITNAQLWGYKIPLVSSFPPPPQTWEQKTHMMALHARW